MLAKKIGEPCPKCATRLMRRRSKFARIEGDVAYCARCDASFELAADEIVLIPALLAQPV